MRTSMLTGILACWVMIGALPFAEASPSQSQVLGADDAADDDVFGTALSASGDTLVVGAPGVDDTGDGPGAVYVFVRSAGVWSQQAKLTPDDDSVQAFGSSVGVSGDTVVVSASPTAAYVFTRTGTLWSENAVLSVAGTSGPIGIGGRRVSVHGSTIALGYFGDDEAGANAGAVFVFERTGSSWTQQAKLIASDAMPGDSLGASVSIWGDSIIAGAASAGDQGAAYVFSRSGTVWSEDARLDGDCSISGPYDRCHFGHSVSIWDDTAVVGAYLDSPLGFDSGSAYVFTRHGGSWIHEAELLPSDGVARDNFGVTVAVRDDVALVGANRHSHSVSQFGPLCAQGLGAAYLFERHAGTWVELVEVTIPPSGPTNFRGIGRSVSLSADWAFVGATNDYSTSGVTNNFGHVLTCSLGTTGPDCNGNGLADEYEADCNCNAIPDDCDIAAGVDVDCNGNGIPDTCDILSGSSFDCDGNSVPDECHLTFAETYCSCSHDAPCGNIDPTRGCANHTERGARIYPCGTSSVTADDLVLHVRNLPPEQHGLFFMGPIRDQQPFGDGQRCINGGTSGLSRFPVRLSDHDLNSGIGFISEGPGIVAYSQANFTPANRIQAGQTWNFQHWHRDVLGPCSSSFNLTNAVAVTFAP